MRLVRTACKGGLVLTGGGIAIIGGLVLINQLLLWGQDRAAKREQEERELEPEQQSGYAAHLLTEQPSPTQARGYGMTAHSHSSLFGPS